MNLRDLRYLLAVIEHGHFGRAAEACGVSQPTLSVQLRKLEAELGIALLERGARGVAPTAACLRLLPHVRAAVAEADAIQAVARSLRDPLAGPIRLGIIPTLAPYLLPRVLAGLARAPAADGDRAVGGPDRLLARTSRRARARCLRDRNRAGRADARVAAAVRRGLPRRPAACASAGRAAKRSPRRSSPATSWCWPRATACATRPSPSAAPPPASRCARRAWRTLMHLVAAGYGTTLIPALAAEAARDMGLVVRPLATPASRTLRLVWRARSPRRAAVEALAAAIPDLVGRT
ncbi:MAG: LysR family transcriptional regulator [Acetobacteraceae bacterium]|nr:LysR family transcriptional regulator [Acetobacteraceae bacterium]